MIQGRPRSGYSALSAVIVILLFLAIGPVLPAHSAAAAQTDRVPSSLANSGSSVDTDEPPLGIEARLASAGVALGAVSDDGFWTTLISPTLRTGVRMVRDTRRNRMLLFGGTDGQVFFHDVWELSLSTPSSWTPLPVIGVGPKGRSFPGVVYDHVGDRLIIHGGRDAAQRFSDVWELPLSASAGWNEITPELPGAAPRYAHSAVLDSARNRLVIFGGKDVAVLNDTWALSLELHPAWTRLQENSTPPSPRYDHASAYDPVHERLLISGGYGCDNDCFLRDSWVLSLSSDTPWDSLRVTTLPPRHVGATGLYDSSRNRFVFHGGLNSARTPVGTVRVLPLDPVGGWTALGTSGIGIPGRTDLGAATLAGGASFLVWGGSTTDARVLRGTMSATGVAWSAWLTPTVPNDRWYASAVMDADRNRMIIFGGRDGNPMTSLWTLELTGTPRWVSHSVAGGPSARSEHSTIVDPLRNRMLLFGGISGSGNQSDLWALSLSPQFAWSEITPNPQYGEPSARRAHTAIYDPVRDRMIVCGGNQLNASLNDVWALSLARQPAWQQIVPSGSFTAREYHSAVYDARRDRMIVFGGHRNGTILGDVQALSLSGTAAWAAISPAGSPPQSRYSHSAIYDPIRDRMVLFGGQSTLSADRLNDCWELKFSGAPTWQALIPDEQVPHARLGATSVYDPHGDRMIMFGGWDFSGRTDVVTLGWDPDAAYSAGSQVTPSTGAATGEVTVEVAQSAHVEGMSAWLSMAGTATVPALLLGPAEDPSATLLRFDLRGVAPGIYDLTLDFPSGSDVVLPACFTVVPTGEPEVWVNLQGRNAIRNGRPATYFIEFGNDGPVDAVGVPLFVSGIPVNATYSLSPSPLDPAPGPHLAGFDWSQYPLEMPADGALGLPLLLSRVAAGSRAHFVLTITWSQAIGSEFTLEAAVGDPWFTHNPTPSSLTSRMIASASGTTDESQAAEHCRGLDAEFIANLIASFQFEGGSHVVLNCMGAALTVPFELVWSAEEAEETCRHFGSNSGWCLSDLFKTRFDAYMSHLHGFADCVIPGDAWAEAAHPMARVWFGSKALLAGWNILKCNFIEGHSTVARLPIRITGSHDPNDKIGPWGSGLARWTSPISPFGYRINFENVETATAAAAEVVITDAIDASRFDLKSFALGPITIGSRTIKPPRRLSRWTTDVDLRPTTNLLVHIDAALDRTTGIARWGFVSLDPATGLASEDPISGFLPPNVESPEGEGSVSYSIRTRAGLAEGTEAQNAASIVFDVNEPIVTPAWINTLDAQPPISRVLDLAANTADTSFLVQWSGQDSRSGIEGYTVFVSRDGRPYEVWRTGDAALADTFVTSSERVLMFYSIARDSAGNFEPNKTRPEAGISTSTDVDPSSIARPLSLALRGAHPVRGPLEMTLSLATDAPARVGVFDLLGRRVLEIPIVVPGSGAGPLTVVSRARLAAGMYVVRLTQSGQSVSRRVIVIR